MHAALDAHTRRTAAARIRDRLAAGIGDLATIETVQGLTNGKRRLSFRGAGGTGEEQARRQRPAHDGSGEQFDETLVAGDVAKRHGTGIVSLDAGYKAVGYQPSAIS
jgi:hypothetical protein